jgi:hypothetical protein
MSAFDALAARLVARAAALIERRRQEHWWRQPRLLWPDFTKD